MLGPKCYFVGPFPTDLPQPTLKYFVSRIYLHAFSKHPQAQTVAIYCSENTTPLIENSPILSCKLQSTILYTAQQHYQFFANCVLHTQYFPFLHEFGPTLSYPYSPIFQSSSVFSNV